MPSSNNTTTSPGSKRALTDNTTDAAAAGGAAGAGAGEEAGGKRAKTGSKSSGVRVCRWVGCVSCVGCEDLCKDDQMTGESLGKCGTSGLR